MSENGGTTAIWAYEEKLKDIYGIQDREISGGGGEDEAIIKVPRPLGRIGRQPNGITLW